MNTSIKKNRMLSVFAAILIFFNLAIPATKSFAQHQIMEMVGVEFNSELQCLSENIYYESASEPFEGKLAVAQVTINRVKSGKFANTICGVVNQKDKINGYTVCQFSWVCNSIKGMIRNKYQWEESQIVARRALTEATAHDLLYNQNALYYHNTQVSPGWHLTKVTQIGHHIFYK